MKIIQAAVAGTLESSDAMITVEPNNEDTGITIDLNSTVEVQFGDVIRDVIGETVRQLGIESARITVVDKGALDCALRARVKAAVYRACNSEDYRSGGGSQ